MFLEHLINAIRQHVERSPLQAPQQAQQQPDFTFNPNQNTNIPYSTHDVNAARQFGQGVFQPNQAPDVTYNPNPNTNIPNSSHNMQQIMNQNGIFGGSQALGMVPQYGQQTNYSTPLQGLQNPGYTPLQNGGSARPGSNPYATGLQPASRQLYGGLYNYDPQQGYQLY